MIDEPIVCKVSITLWFECSVVGRVICFNCIWHEIELIALFSMWLVNCVRTRRTNKQVCLLC